MRSLHTDAALLGRGGDFPFAGHFHGVLDAPTGGTRLSWAGRVTSGADRTLAWRAARALHNALLRQGPIEADRRLAASIAWARVDGVSRDILGPNRGDGLVLLLVARDDQGIAVSAVGLSAVLSIDDGEVHSWIADPHPMLGLPGLPAKRPGALTSDEAPAWLVGVPHGSAVPDLSVDDLLTQAGVHR